MRLTNTLLLILLGFLFVAPALNAAEKEADNDAPFDPKPMIMHHISDSHEWHLWDVESDDGEVTEYSIPLPVILYHNGNLELFLSSAFDHGKKNVTKSGAEFTMYHDKIYFANEIGGIDMNDKGEVLNDRPIDISITKNVFMMLVSAVLLVFLFGSAGKFYKKKGISVPRGITSFLEPLVVFVRDDIARPIIGEDKYEKFLPFLLTAFFFIWINNLLGLIPFFPGGANVTGNISVTLVLAVFTFILTNVNGNKHYWRHIFAMPGVPIYVLPIMIVVELVGLIVKPVALMIRLFANITAGHIIILSLISLIFIFETLLISPVSIAFGLFMNVLELLVAALQAYIFTLLSALFIGGAVAEEH